MWTRVHLKWMKKPERRCRPAALFARSAWGRRRLGWADLICSIMNELLDGWRLIGSDRCEGRELIRWIFYSIMDGWMEGGLGWENWVRVNWDRVGMAIDYLVSDYCVFLYRIWLLVLDVMIMFFLFILIKIKRIALFSINICAANVLLY